MKSGRTVRLKTHNRLSASFARFNYVLAATIEIRAYLQKYMSQ
jgi:hypothetical protein